jgi:membrane-bound ClpP family serine protease
MTAVGSVLLLIGVALLVAESHLPGGVLGVLGGIALIVGGVILVGAAGGGAAVALPVGIGLGLAATGWVLVATHTAASVRRGRARAGSEALCGRVGIVRQWSEPAGQVFVEGALWRARRGWGEDDAETLHEGDPVVVEQVNGLTLSVRRAEDWELVT